MSIDYYEKKWRNKEIKIRRAVQQTRIWYGYAKWGLIFLCVMLVAGLITFYFALFYLIVIKYPGMWTLY